MVNGAKPKQHAHKRTHTIKDHLMDKLEKAAAAASNAASFLPLFRIL